MGKGLETIEGAATRVPPKTSRGRNRSALLRIWEKNHSVVRQNLNFFPSKLTVSLQKPKDFWVWGFFFYKTVFKERVTPVG